MGPGCSQSTKHLFMILMLLWVNFCAACHLAVSFLSRILSAGLAVSQAGWWSLILLNLQNGLLILILHSTEHCAMQPPSVHPTRRRCLGSDKAASLESTLGNRRGFHLANGIRLEPWLHRKAQLPQLGAALGRFKVPLASWRLFSFTYFLLHAESYLILTRQQHFFVRVTFQLEPPRKEFCWKQTSSQCVVAEPWPLCSRRLNEGLVKGTQV